MSRIMKLSSSLWSRFAAMLAALFFVLPISSHAQTVTLQGASGNSCTFTSASYSANNWVFVCTGGGGSNSAALTFGAASGSLGTVGATTATIAISCAGTCAGITTTASVNPPVSGVSVSGSIANGVGTITVHGTGPLSAGSANIVFATPSGAGVGVTVTPNASTTVSVPIVDSTSKGVLGFSLATTTATADGTPITVNIQRAGAGAASGAAGVGYTCSTVVAGSGAYTPTISPAPSVWPNTVFTWNNDVDPSKTVTITPPALPASATSATITCSLNALYGAGLGIAQFALTVTPPASQPTGCPTGGGSTPDFSHDETNTFNTSLDVLLAPTQTFSMKFSPTADNGWGLKTNGNIAYGSPKSGYANAHAELVISDCAGKFTTPLTGNGCTRLVTGSATTMNFSTNPSSAYCRLDASKTYYLNVRYRNSAGGNSCTAAICGSYVNLNRN